MFEVNKEKIIHLINEKTAHFLKAYENADYLASLNYVSNMLPNSLDRESNAFESIDIDGIDKERLGLTFYHAYKVFSLGIQFCADILGWLNGWDYLVSRPNLPGVEYSDIITYADLKTEAVLILSVMPFCENLVTALKVKYDLKEEDFLSIEYSFSELAKATRTQEIIKKFEMLKIRNFYESTEAITEKEENKK